MAVLRSDLPEAGEWRLPRRDYLLLPLLSLLTVAIIFAGSEIATRLIWAEHDDDSCFINDPVNGFGFKPNCTSRLKTAEGQWSTNHYNDCGYRSNTSCGPKPAGALRIALVGSSVAEAVYLPDEQTYYERMARTLRAACGQVIDIQNLGGFGSSPIWVYRRLGETLALKPDVVIYALTPFDLEQQIDPVQLAQRNSAQSHGTAPAANAQVGFAKGVQLAITQSRTALIAQHFLFQNQQTFIKLYLVYGDKADFLRTPLSPAWQQRYRDLEVLITDMADRVHAAGVPLVIVPVPSRAEAAMLSARQLPSNIDAFDFGRRVQAIAARHGVQSIDLTSVLARLPDAEQLYYVVDGHLMPEGQNVLATNMSAHLLGGTVPAFASCSATRGGD